MNQKTTPSSGFSKRRFIKSVTPIIWLLPSLILITVIVIFPIYEMFVTSISEVSRSGIRKELNGLKNYINLLNSDTFLLVLKNTLIWTIAVVGISTILSLAIAVLLNQDFPGRKLVRAALIIPWAVSLIITAAIWKYMFDFNYGTLNLILSKLGIIKDNIYWLANASTSFPAMIGVGIFVTIPFTTFVMLSGLQSISNDLYEAASVDGAGAWRKFFSITLPLLKPSLMVSTVLNTIYVFNSFPIVWTITRGDPVNQTDLVVTYLYKLAFESKKMGEAAAISTISFCILLLFAIVYVSLSMRGEKSDA